MVAELSQREGRRTIHTTQQQGRNYIASTVQGVVVTGEGVREGVSEWVSE